MNSAKRGEFFSLADQDANTAPPTARKGRDVPNVPLTEPDNPHYSDAAPRKR